MKRQITRADADDIAIRALGFLVSDPERLGQFLAATGLGPDNLRSAAREPAFLASVMAHVAADDSLLLAIAGSLSLKPETVAEANLLLNPPWVDP
jgi:hypothetical protein